MAEIDEFTEAMLRANADASLQTVQTDEQWRREGELWREPSDIRMVLAVARVALERAIEAARSERLFDPTDDPADLAYDRAIEDVIGAIRAIIPEKEPPSAR